MLWSAQQAPSRKGVEGQRVKVEDNLTCRLIQRCQPPVTNPALVPIHPTLAQGAASQVGGKDLDSVSFVVHQIELAARENLCGRRAGGRRLWRGGHDDLAIVAIDGSIGSLTQGVSIYWLACGVIVAR